MSNSLSQKSSRYPSRGALLWAVLGLAVGWAATHSSLAKKASERVPVEPFRHVYVQSKIGSATKCLVTDRAGATARRSEPELINARWKCRWREGADGPLLSALTGKEPSYLFVPEAAVKDPVLPLIYESVRRAEALPLPRVRWVQLFYDRQYRGLYLQIRLPGKKWATDLGLGRAELLQTNGASTTCWNRKLEASCVLWNGGFIAESIFPAPVWSPGLSLLNDLLAGSGFQPRTFVLNELAPDGNHLWPMPLPVDLSRHLPGESYSDGRYPTWSRATEPPLTAAAAQTQGVELPDATWARQALTDATESSSMVDRLDRSPSLAWLSGVAPPTVAPPTVAPPTVAPPTVAPPTVAPPTVAPPNVGGPG